MFTGLDFPKDGLLGALPLPGSAPTSPLGARCLPDPVSGPGHEPSMTAPNSAWHRKQQINVATTVNPVSIVGAQ